MYRPQCKTMRPCSYQWLQALGALSKAECCTSKHKNAVGGSIVITGSELPRCGTGYVHLSFMNIFYLRGSAKFSRIVVLPFSCKIAFLGGGEATSPCKKHGTMAVSTSWWRSAGHLIRCIWTGSNEVSGRWAQASNEVPQGPWLSNEAAKSSSWWSSPSGDGILLYISS